MSRKYWTGNKIDKLEENEIFLYGSNPQGINGAGAAKAAMSLSKGAKNGIGRGFNGSNAYALVTKSLNAGFLEKSTGILYDKEGYCSVSPEQIRTNIDELYEIAKSPEHKDKKFLVSYQYETWANGTPKKSLNGYTSQEMLEMFVRKDMPENIVFHNSYKPHLEKALAKLSSIEDSSTKQPQTTNQIAFTKVSLPFGWMGNMAPYSVVYEGQEYKTTEALFQSLRFEGFPDIQQKIMDEKSPMSAKLVAKEHKHILEQNCYVVMGQKDVENMRLCVKLKLEQHPELAQQLIDTGNTPIIEDCTNRPEGSGLFWGSAMQEGQWVGKNVLGNILMDFRYKLQNNQELVVNIENKPEEKKEMQPENKPKEYTYFFHLTSPFSNFHPSKIEYKDLTFVSNEQFMMYSKAKTFKDEITAQKIIDMNNQPLIKDFIEGKYSREDIVKDKVLADQWNKLMMKVKGFGREVKNYDDNVWTNRRAKVVLFGAREKFTQNEDLKQILLDTGDTKMVEVSPYDKLSTMQHIIQKLKEEFSLENKRRIFIKVGICSKKKVLKTGDNSANIEVVNFYHIGQKIPEDGIYIGRFNYKFNLEGSIFANPFPVRKPEERGTTIEKYREWLWNQVKDGKITKEDILKLKDKKLVCYCKPKACHGDVVKDLVNFVIENEDEFNNIVNKKKLKP